MQTARAALAFACACAILQSTAATVSAAAPARFPAANPYQCPDPAPGQTQTQVMINVDSAYAFKSNLWTSFPIGRLVKYQCYIVIGRDQNFEWLLFNYGVSQAWVHRSAVVLKDGDDVTKIALAPTAPLKTTGARLVGGLPAVGFKTKQWYAASVRAGHNPRVVAVMGDCNSEPPAYFNRLAAGMVSLTAYPKLAKTYTYFSPSFARKSLATHGSFNATMAFDPTWSDPKACNPNEGPLVCELRSSNASIILISLGTGDTFTWQTFEADYRKILDTAVVAKVLPVLITKADALESRQGGAAPGFINAVIRKLGAEYGAPVIDFAAAAANLPNNGLMEERDASAQPTMPFHLNDIGMDTRALMTLQVLSAISGK